MSSTLKSIIALVAALAVSVLTLYYGPAMNLPTAIILVIALGGPAIPIIYVLYLLKKNG